MARVTVTELRRHTSAIIRHLRDGGEIVEITCRGEVVAQLMPVRNSVDPQKIEEIWARRDRLASEISALWPKGVTAAEAIAEDRRDL